MRFVHYQGEASIADLARRIVDFEGRGDANTLVETVSRALLQANPQLKQIERLSADTLIAIPELPGVKLAESSQPFSGIGDELARSIRSGMAAAQASLESSGRREVDDARNTLELIASPEMLELAESDPAVKERLPQLKETANGRIQQMELNRRLHSLAFKELKTSADRLLGASGAAKLLSMTVETTALAADESSTAVVCLDAPAPEGGAVVKLSSDQADLVKIPAKVTVPAGEISTIFPLSASEARGAANTPIALQADYGGESLTANLLLTPRATTQAVRLDTMTLAENAVDGDTSVIGTLTLSGPAPADGAVVNLSIAGAAGEAVTLESANVTFAAGEVEKEFVIETSDVAVKGRAEITAEFAGEENTVELEVRPLANVLVLASLTFEKETIFGGESVKARVTLSSLAPQTVRVGLMTTVTPLLGASEVSVPEYVEVRGKQKTASFTVRTRSVRRKLTLKIQANYGGVVQEATLAIKRR